MKEMMKKYTTLTDNKLETTVLAQLTGDIKQSVARGQACADYIVNALSKQEVTAVDVETASKNMAALLGAPPVIRDHWRPFVDEAAKLLPHEVQDDLARMGVGSIALDAGPTPTPEDLREQLLEQEGRLADALAQLEEVRGPMKAEIDRLRAENTKLGAELEGLHKSLSEATEALAAEKKRAGELEHAHAVEKKKHKDK